MAIVQVNAIELSKRAAIQDQVLEQLRENSRKLDGIDSFIRQHLEQSSRKGTP